MRIISQLCLVVALSGACAGQIIFPADFQLNPTPEAAGIHNTIVPSGSTANGARQTDIYKFDIDTGKVEDPWVMETHSPTHTVASVI